MPPEEALLKHYGVLCADHVKMNAATIDIDRMTKSGTHWLVTTRGHRVLSTLMNKMGVLTMEHLLVQELPPSQCILKDGMPEYCIINSNHHIQTAQQLFPGKSFKWCCDIVDVHYSFLTYFVDVPAPTNTLSPFPEQGLGR
jgi:hypothetical protein